MFLFGVTWNVCVSVFFLLFWTKLHYYFSGLYLIFHVTHSKQVLTFNKYMHHMVFFHMTDICKVYLFKCYIILLIIIVTRLILDSKKMFKKKIRCIWYQNIPLLNIFLIMYLMIFIRVIRFHPSVIFDWLVLIDSFNYKNIYDTKKDVLPAHKYWSY